VAADDKIEIQITLDDGSIKKGFIQIEKEGKATGKKLGKEMSGGIDDGMSAIAGNLKKLAGPAALAAGGLYALKKSLDFTREAEQIRTTANQFDVLSKRAGIAGSALRDALTSASDGRLDDTDLMAAANKALLNLDQFANRLPEILTVAKNATDVFGGSVINNFEAINQAIASGNTRTLKQLGIFIDAEKAMSDYAKTLGVTKDLLNESGRQQAILNAVLEKGKTAYEGISPSRPVTTAFEQLNVQLNQLAENMKKIAAASTEGFWTNFAKLAGSTLQGINNRMVSWFGSGMEKDAARMSVLSGELEKYRRELELMEKHGGSGFAAQIKQTQGRISSLTNEYNKLASAQSAIASAQEHERRKGLPSGPGAVDPKTDHIDLEKQAAKRAEEAKKNKWETTTPYGEMVGPQAPMDLANSYREVLQGLDAEINAFALNSEENFNRLGATMFNTLGTGAANAFASFGRAIAKGQNGLKAFANALLATMGQTAIQLGTQFMLQGAAYMWAGMPNGPPLIAAGAALAAFGGVLSSVGGGEGGGVAGGGLSPGADTLTTSPPENENKKQTQVVVNVHGNILDRRETGLEIANILNETFATNDGRLVQAV
jgi:hypothetical protein